MGKPPCPRQVGTPIAGHKGVEKRMRSMVFCGLRSLEKTTQEDLMRLSTVMGRLLGVTGTTVRDVYFAQDGLVVEVKPRWRRARCGLCARRAPGYDQREMRRWRHLPFGATLIWLSYAPRRVQCGRCQRVCTEALPWAAHGSRFTRPMEELVAYLARASDKTSVSQLLGISWRAVGAIVQRVVAQRRRPLVGRRLRCIGVDEFSYRKRHRYLTVVVDHERREVVWAGVGRSAETLKGFFDELGESACKDIERVTMDMAAGYRNAVHERLAQAEIVFDRFHVQRLASDALDELRRAQVRALKGTEQAKQIKGSRFILLKSWGNLTREGRSRLSEIQRTNHKLYRGYLLKESLAGVLDYRQPKRARAALEQWLAWATRSRLEPFIKLARTIRQHKEGILAFIKGRHTNAVVEGINNRLRMVARRAFGFHGPQALISMLFLCCGDIRLNPPLPVPT